MRISDSRVVLTALLTVLGGCQRENKQAVRDSAVAASPAVAAAQSQPSTMQTPPVGGGTVCPNWGNWEPCNVENRLSRAGLSFKRTENVIKYDFMHVPGIEYETPVAKIHVFIYPNQAARAADSDKLDAETASPKDNRFYYKEPAVLVTTINLSAIVITLNERQAERISDALGAGLPADPPSGKKP
ncbi:MAG: hypothetical protein U0132_09250 [Gemmatimonadaceae bacterium]